MSAHPLALVTGGAKRVGRAIALKLAHAGCDVIITYGTSADEGERTCTEIESLGVSARRERLDLADAVAVDGFASRLGLDRLDVLVHNASVYFPTPLGSTTPADAEKLWRINALAPLLLTKGFAPALRNSMLDTASVVCMCDMHVLGRPRKQFAPYAMSKAALVEMVRSLARELAPRVRVNGIAPGVIQWPDSGYESDEASQRAYLSRVPLARSGTPEEAAELVRWLSLDAGYVTGEIIRLDGGRWLA